MASASQVKEPRRRTKRHGDAADVDDGDGDVSEEVPSADLQVETPRQEWGAHRGEDARMSFPWRCATKQIGSRWKTDFMGRRKSFVSIRPPTQSYIETTRSKPFLLRYIAYYTEL